MSELSIAFKPLLSQTFTNYKNEVFKDEWYSYEIENDKRNNNEPIIQLNQLVPSLKDMQIKKTMNRLKKPVNTSDTSELLFSIFF